MCNGLSTVIMEEYSQSSIEYLLRRVYAVHKDLLKGSTADTQRLTAALKRAEEKSDRLQKKNHEFVLENQRLHTLITSRKNRSGSCCNHGDVIGQSLDTVITSYQRVIQDKDTRIGQLEREVLRLQGRLTVDDNSQIDVALTPLRSLTAPLTESVTVTPKDRSPDSTCRITPKVTSEVKVASKRSSAAEELTFDTSLEESSNTQKLHLRRKRGKRRRYNEEVSPEYKRVRQSSPDSPKAVKQETDKNDISVENDMSIENDMSVGHDAVVDTVSDYTENTSPKGDNSALYKLSENNVKIKNSGKSKVGKLNENAKVLVPNTCDVDLDVTVTGHGLNLDDGKTVSVNTTKNEIYRNGDTDKVVGRKGKLGRKKQNIDVSVMCIPETLAMDVDSDFDDDGDDNDDNGDDNGGESGDVGKIGANNYNKADLSAIAEVSQEEETTKNSRKTERKSGKEKEFCLRSILVSPDVNMVVNKGKTKCLDDQGSIDRTSSSHVDHTSGRIKEMGKAGSQNEIGQEETDGNRTLVSPSSDEDSQTDEMPVSQKFERVQKNMKVTNKADVSDLSFHGNACKNMKEVNALFETPLGKGRSPLSSDSSDNFETVGQSNVQKNNTTKRKPKFRKMKTAIAQDVILRRSPRKHRSDLSQNQTRSSPTDTVKGSYSKRSPNKSVKRLIKENSASENVEDEKEDNDDDELNEDGCHDDSVADGCHGNIDNPDGDLTIAPELVEGHVRSTHEDKYGTFNAESQSLDFYNVVPVQNGVLNNSKKFQIIGTKRKPKIVKTGSESITRGEIDNETNVKPVANVNKYVKNKHSNKSTYDHARYASAKETRNNLDETLKSPSILNNKAACVDRPGTDMNNAITISSPLYNNKAACVDRPGADIDNIITISSPTVSSPSIGALSDVDSPLLLRKKGKTSEVIDVDTGKDDTTEWKSKSSGKRTTSQSSQSSRRSLRSSLSNGRNTSQKTLQKAGVKNKIYSMSVDRNDKVKNKLSKNLHQTTLTQAFFSPKKQSNNSNTCDGIEIDVDNDDDDDLKNDDDDDLRLAMRLSLEEEKAKTLKGSDDEESANVDIEVLSPFKKPLGAPRRDGLSRRKHKRNVEPEINVVEEGVANDGDHNESLDWGETSEMDLGQRSGVRRERLGVRGQKGNELKRSVLQEVGNQRSNITNIDVINEEMTMGHRKSTSASVESVGRLDPAVELSDWCREPDTLPSLEPADFCPSDLDHGTQSLPRTSTMAMEESQDIPSSSTSCKFPSRRRKYRHDAENIDPSPPRPDLLDDSFDRPPKKPENNVAHVAVVRKRDERQKLQGHGCKQCIDFYKAAGRSDTEMKAHMDQCSRHRAQYVPPDTPEHFWSVDFIETQDCPETVELETDDKAHTYRRRRRLNKYFRSKDEHSTVDDDSQDINLN